MTQKLQNKLTNFKEALKRLREGVTAYKSNQENTIYRDAMIQRFEFTFELAWKSVSVTLQDHGIILEFNTPKTVLQAAYEAGYIEDETAWLSMLEARNMMSHTYDEATADAVADKICNSYTKAIGNLLKKIEA